MRENETHTENQEETKRRIRERYKGISKDELEFIPATPRESLFEDTGEKRVCAYCRVSTDDPKQTSSYELQKNHYEDMIKEHSGWVLVDIYADEGISGTSLQHRDSFNRMMADCRAGKIDVIVTKSVSRFARNIVDCIAKVRELASLKPPVGVFFETEHIDTLGSTSEMMLAVLSAAAQEESHTKSEIMNISIEQRFSRGIFLTPELLGYDVDENGELQINSDEAKTVMLCYYLFLSGKTTTEIAELLTELKRPTKLGNTKWSNGTVTSVLRNERRCGDVLSRKTFTPNFLDHKSRKNKHDRNQYKQRDHHDAIVDRSIYDAAQSLLEAYRYQRKGYPLPTLQVIDGGALKGFVPVNRGWHGFTAGDYKLASESAYEGKEVAPSKAAPQSHFDLSDYQVVRTQFFSSRGNPALTFQNGYISFGTGCMKKFGNVEYVEMLFNSVEKCLAIRPCDADAPNAIRWGVLDNNRWRSVRKSCRGFSDPLFEVMDWCDDYRYKFNGQYAEHNGQAMMLFDLSEPEVKMPLPQDKMVKATQSEPSQIITENEQTEPATNNAETARHEKIVRKQTPCYFPEEWVGKFGYAAINHEPILLERIKGYGDWEILKPAIEVAGYREITQDTIRKLSQEAAQMILEMRGAG